jgi:hypothetical protein
MKRELDRISFTTTITIIITRAIPSPEPTAYMEPRAARTANKELFLRTKLRTK